MSTHSDWLILCAHWCNLRPMWPLKVCTVKWILLEAEKKHTKTRQLSDTFQLTCFAIFSFSFFSSFLALSPTAPEESSSSDDPLFSEPVAPTLSLGERVAWVKSSGPEFGVVKWIGRMPQITNDWTVGIEFVSKHLFITHFYLNLLTAYANAFS